MSPKWEIIFTLLPPPFPSLPKNLALPKMPPVRACRATRPSDIKI